MPTFADGPVTRQWKAGKLANRRQRRKEGGKCQKDGGGRLSERKDRPAPAAPDLVVALKCKGEGDKSRKQRGAKMGLLSTILLPKQGPFFPFPSSALSISISDPLAWHLLLLQWVKCGEDGEGKVREEGMPIPQQ